MYNDGSDGSGERVIVEYNGGQDGRTAEVTFVCTPGTVSSGFAFLQENAYLTYEMQVNTMYACAATPTKACAPGSSGAGGGGATSTFATLFLVVVFVVPVVYFAGFYAYNMKVKGAIGRERIPHVDFWASTPGLVKDGIGFVFSKARGTGYQTLE